MQTTKKPKAPATTTALFAHQPRPPKLGGGEHDWQRRFGGHCALIQRFAGFRGTDLRMTVFRAAHRDVAELRFVLDINNNTASENTITLTADELQILACALLDAAHDLRTNPPEVGPMTTTEAAPA